MKSIFIKIKIIMIFFGLLLSCDNNSKSNQENNDKLKLLKIENIELQGKMKQLVKALESAPIGKRVNNHMEDNFYANYLGFNNNICSTGNRADQIQNFTVSNVPDFKISIPDFQDLMGFNFTDNFESDEGLLFFYLLRPDDQLGDYYFSYVIIRATRDKLDSSIRCVSPNRYIAFDKTTFSTTIDYAPFSRDYNSRVVSKDFYPCVKHEPISTGGLPTSCFYYFSDLKKFYAHNLSVPEGISHLHIINAAITIEIKRKNGETEHLSAQVPMLKWGDANKPIELDNDYDHGYGYYHKKAMDVGHLCPPDCTTPQPPSCP